MNLGAGQPASLPYGVESQWWYSYHSMQFSSPLRQSDPPIFSVCYHPPPPGNYPPPLHLTQPNHYPPPHHFTPPNPYPPLLHFVEPNSYPPPPTPNPYSAYAYHPHQPSYPHTQPHFIPTNQVVPPHITHEPPPPIADLMHVEPDPPLQRLDEFMDSVSRLLDDCISKCMRGIRVSECSSPSLRDDVVVPTQTPKSQSSEPRICSPLRQQPIAKPSSLLGGAQSLNSSPLISPVVHSHLYKARCKQVPITSMAATGGVKKHHSFGLGASTIHKIAKYQKRSSAASLLLDDAISAQSNHNPTSLRLVSGTGSSVPNLNFVNNDCGRTDYVTGAMLSGVDMIFDNEKRSSDMTVMDSGYGKKLSEHVGIGVKLDGMQGSYSAECHALKVFDKTSNSDGFCGSGVAALRRIRDKGGGLAYLQPLDYANGMNFADDFGKFVEKDDQADHRNVVSKMELDETANEFKKKGELKEKFEGLCKAFKAVMVDCIEKVVVFDCEVNSPSCLKTDNYGCTANMKRAPALRENIMAGYSPSCLKTDNYGCTANMKRAPALRENIMAGYMFSKTTMEMSADCVLDNVNGSSVKEVSEFGEIAEATHISVETILQLPEKNIVAEHLYSSQGSTHQRDWCKQELREKAISVVSSYPHKDGAILNGNKNLILHFLTNSGDSFKLTFSLVISLIELWKYGYVEQNIIWFTKISVTSSGKDYLKHYYDQGLIITGIKLATLSANKFDSVASLLGFTTFFAGTSQQYWHAIRVESLTAYSPTDIYDTGTSLTTVPQTVGNVFRCNCGISITPNYVNVCFKCLQYEVDNTEDFHKQVALALGFECDTYLQPQRTWIKTLLELNELLAFCIERLKNKFGTTGDHMFRLAAMDRIAILSENVLMITFGNDKLAHKWVLGLQFSRLEILTLIDLKWRQEDHVVIRIAVLKIYLCLCLLCGKMKDDNEITHHSSVEVDKSASHMRLVFEKEESFMVIGYDIADEIALNETGVAEIASKMIIVITRVDDVLEFSSMGSMEVMIVGLSNIIVPELICRAKVFGTQASIARAVADVVVPNSKSNLCSQNAKSMLLFLADGISKPMSLSSFASALSKACESASAVRYEHTDLELLMWIGDGLEESHFPLEDIILLPYCDEIITQFLKYLSSNQLQQFVKSLTSSCFGDLPLTMILYSFWVIKAEHKGMSCLPFEDSNYSTIPWSIYIFLGLGVTLCGITYSILLAAYIASGATTQGNMLHDKVLDSSTYSDDSTDDSPGINRRRGYLGRSFGYHGSFSRFSDLIKA